MQASFHLLTCEKYLSECIISLRGHVWAHITSSILPLFYARLETGRIMWLGMAVDGRAGVHTSFRTITLVLYKLGHMIPLWKGKNPIYVGVIRSKVKVTVTMNIIFLWCLTPLSTIYQLYRGRSVLLAEESGVPRENHQLAASHWQTWSHTVVPLALSGFSNPQHQWW